MRKAAAKGSRRKKERSMNFRKRRYVDYRRQGTEAIQKASTVQSSNENLTLFGP